MIEVEQIEEWRGQSVIDSDGEPLGKLDEVFFDIASGAPVLVSVKSGLLGRHSTLVPIDGARFGRNHVRMAHAKAAVEGAAAASGSGEGAPTREVLAALGPAYGLRFAEQLQLERASEKQAREAEAEAARQRAAELAETARAMAAERDAAGARAEGAHADAQRAETEADQARRAALEAREEARRLDER